MQALQGFFLVLFLASMRLCLDDDDAILADALIVQCKQSLLDVFRQRRRTDIETQMDRIRNLVHILTARALRANCGELDFVFGNGRGADDMDPVSVKRHFIVNLGHIRSRPAMTEPL